MIWLTWRQFRPQAIAAACALAAVAIVLVATRPGLSAGYTAAGLSACHAHCATAASIFLDRVGNFDKFLDFAGVLLIIVAPALMGLFWGAPLIAREVADGTHRIAWNQSVTRTRWTIVKLGLVGLAAEVQELVEVADPVEEDARGRGAVGVAGGQSGGGVAGGQAGPGRRQHDCHCRQGADRRDGLRAELAPGQPDHWCTSSLCSCGDPEEGPM
jgi:hypothetical protein